MSLLSGSEKKQIIRGKKNAACSSCGGRDFEVDDVSALQQIDKAVPEGLEFAPSFIPVLPVKCQNCDHVDLFVVKKELEDMGKV